MNGSRRHAHIVERLQRDGRVDVIPLSAELGISGLTVRRDLDQLAERGVLRRVRGGAVSLLMRGEELPYAMREIDNSVAKERIAQAAAALIRDGEAVVVDSGTSGSAMARALIGRRLTVMPLSVQAATLLATSAATTLILPGGTARFGEGTLVGPMTEANLADLRFDTTLLTCCGVGQDAGITAYDLQDAAVKRTAVRVSTRVVLLAEGAKFSRTAVAHVCALDVIDIVVTDDSAPADARARLEDAGIPVVVT